MRKKGEKSGRYCPKSGETNLPYGWKWDERGETIVKDAFEQKNILLAKRLAAKGLSHVKIGGEFEARGLLNRAGNTNWWAESVRQLILNDGLSDYWTKRKGLLDARILAKKLAKAGVGRGVALGELDPVKWGECHLTNRDGSRRIYWAHQVEDLRADDDNIIHLDGRDVGKTADLSTLVLHYALTTENGSGLVAASLSGQLYSILEEIEFQFEQNAQLDECIGFGRNGHRKFQRTPYPRIEFKNGSVLYFRPAGTNGEAFRGVHVDRVWVDEGAWLSEEAWRALRQCLRAGGKMRVYSTPNGLRNTTYYRLTESERWRVFRWPSWLNPMWSAEREADLLEFYGGRGSAGWQHEVAGEHGAVSYGAFAGEVFEKCVRDVLEYRKVVITGAELGDCGTEEEVSLRLEMLLGLGLQEGKFWIGGDLGYTRDPTELLVFKEEAIGCRLEAVGKTDEETRREPKTELRLVLRVHMEGVGYPQIGQCVALLDAVYAPAGIGVDNGGNGVAVVQELLSLNKYKEAVGYRLEAIGSEKKTLGPSRFSGRLFGFDFGGVTRIPLADGGDVRKRTKELMTSLINGALQRREIVFPVDDREIGDQFLTQTYTLSNGVVVYSKGNDHVIDAVRCMMLAREKMRADWVDDAKPVRPPLPLMFETCGPDYQVGWWPRGIVGRLW